MIKYQVVIVSAKGEKRKWMEPFDSMTEAHLEGMSIEEIGRQEGWGIEKIEIVPMPSIQLKTLIGGN